MKLRTLLAVASTIGTLPCGIVAATHSNVPTAIGGTAAPVAPAAASMVASPTNAMLSKPTPAESDSSILTVTGKIGRTNTPDHKSYVFSFADLKKLGNAHITSTTRYVGTATFDGPLIRDILKEVKVLPGASEVSVVAIDGYQKAIPLTDFVKWDVITAHMQDGKRLTVESRGPLWIMYPNDKNPGELLNNETTTKLVWSLTGLVVK